jgi:hypothetical protein
MVRKIIDWLLSWVRPKRKTGGYPRIFIETHSYELDARGRIQKHKG